MFGSATQLKRLQAC